MNGLIDPLKSVLQSDDKTMTQMAVLLYCYGFDLEGLSPLEYIDDWLSSYSKYWIRLAIVEALYQGRYKAISVDHLLRLWKRRGQPTFHFPHEFERLVCRNLVLSTATVDKIKSEPSTTDSTNSQEMIPPNQLDHNNDRKEPIQSTTENLTEEVSTSFQSISHTPDFSSPIINDNDGTSQMSLSPQEDSSWQMKSDGSIHKFVPHSDSSLLYSKLRAVVHQEFAQQT